LTYSEVGDGDVDTCVLVRPCTLTASFILDLTLRSKKTLCFCMKQRFLYELSLTAFIAFSYTHQVTPVSLTHMPSYTCLSHIHAKLHPSLSHTHQVTPVCLPHTPSYTHLSHTHSKLRQSLSYAKLHLSISYIHQVTPITRG